MRFRLNLVGLKTIWILGNSLFPLVHWYYWKLPPPERTLLVIHQAEAALTQGNFGILTPTNNHDPSDSAARSQHKLCLKIFHDIHMEIFTKNPVSWRIKRIYFGPLRDMFEAQRAFRAVAQPRTFAFKRRCCAWTPQRRSWPQRWEMVIITLWWTYKKQWKITIFNGKIHYKWQFSIAFCWFTRGYP